MHNCLHEINVLDLCVPTSLPISSLCFPVLKKKHVWHVCSEITEAKFILVHLEPLILFYYWYVIVFFGHNFVFDGVYECRVFDGVYECRVA
jgi:hypothetical protein